MITDELRKFIKEHIDCPGFDLGTENISEGYGMNEEDVSRPKVICTHQNQTIKFIGRVNTK